MTRKEHPYTREEAYRKYRENPSHFFDVVWHSDAETDLDLLNPDWPFYWSKYHYNLVENGIMEYLHNGGLLQQESLRVMDVGFGAGHWLRFYSQITKVSRMVGVDFSALPVQKMRDKFSDDVELYQWDISQPMIDPLSGGQFDVINAIGVIFHIVCDKSWMQAISNLGTLLADHDSVLIVGGDFGNETVERGVMRKNRSLAEWDAMLNTLNLRRTGLKRYDWWGGADAGLLTDNLLFISRPSAAKQS